MIYLVNIFTHDIPCQFIYCMVSVLVDGIGLVSCDVPYQYTYCTLVGCIRIGRTLCIIYVEVIIISITAVSEKLAQY